MTLLNASQPQNAMADSLYLAGYDGRVFAGGEGWSDRELAVANVMVAILGTMQTMLREVPSILRIQEGRLQLVAIDAGDQRVAVARVAERDRPRTDEQWVDRLMELVAEAS